MSYIALATDQFDAVTAFYGEALGFPVVDKWDRADARGVSFRSGWNALGDPRQPAEGCPTFAGGARRPSSYCDRGGKTSIPRTA
jgi:catechol 2,3-dioxygenase-like lactoylglutathione lyase family enzyme